LILSSYIGSINELILILKIIGRPVK